MSEAPSRDADILSGIEAVVREKLDHEGEVGLETRLVEDLELDSIRLLTLAMEVEDRFRICLDEEDEAAVVTVGDLVALVRSKLERPLEEPA
jgi:acyl carrier protein